MEKIYTGQELIQLYKAGKDGRQELFDFSQSKWDKKMEKEVIGLPKLGEDGCTVFMFIVYAKWNKQFKNSLRKFLYSYDFDQDKVSDLVHGALTDGIIGKTMEIQKDRKETENLEASLKLWCNNKLLEAVKLSPSTIHDANSSKHEYPSDPEDEPYFIGRTKNKDEPPLVNAGIIEPDINSFDPSKELEKKEIFEAITGILKTQTPRAEIILTLRFLKEKKHKEIAEELNSTEQTVKKDFSKYHKRFNESIEQNPNLLNQLKNLL